MNFDLTEEQQLLAATLARFVERGYGFDARKEIVASADGWSARTWSALAELGVLGLPIPVDFGGLGGGAADMRPVMEAIGEALIVEPYLATTGLGGRFVMRGGSPELRRRVLPSIVDGGCRMAFAHTEDRARYTMSHVAVRAQPEGDGYRIEGVKRVVGHATAADLLVVSVRTSGAESDAHGISLLVVDPHAKGVTIAPYRALDGTRGGDIAFDDVHVGRGALIGEQNEGLPLIDEVVDFATALVCAEAIGAMRYANAATLDYLKTRRQFGVPIGSFQALAHRMVDMVASCEQAMSMAALACVTVDVERDSATRQHVVSAAKVKIADACRHISQESVQLHGGMGMTDEMKISHTFRRLTAIAQQFGDADHHLERFATT